MYCTFMAVPFSPMFKQIQCTVVAGPSNFVSHVQRTQPCYMSFEAIFILVQCSVSYWIHTIYGAIQTKYGLPLSSLNSKSTLPYKLHT